MQDIQLANLTANPDIEKPLSLQLVFSGPLALEPAKVLNALFAYHPSMAKAQIDLSDETDTVFGLVGWGKHVIRLVGFNAPFPAEALQSCVGPAHYSQDIKDAVNASTTHLLMYYSGYDETPLEQYVALTALAGVLAEFGALAVLNETAMTSMPAAIFSANSMNCDDRLNELRSLPLTMLYCGFVKYNGNTEGVWMRTFGAHVFGLPDFAALTQGHHEGGRYFELFNNVLGYLLESGATMEAGHTMQIGDTTYMKLRAPGAAEEFLQGGHTVLVAEMIDAAEIN